MRYKKNKAIQIFYTLKRQVQKPPAYIFRRLISEFRIRAERYLAPRRERKLSGIAIARHCGFHSIKTWWKTLATVPYFSDLKVSINDVGEITPADFQRIIESANDAMSNRVDILGSGKIFLGDIIDWQRDYKTGYRWTNRYFKDIEYNNLDQPSDVKFPWELSRMQWMVPLGQAYILTGEECYALAAKKILSHWIINNPYANSVNWSCTMEVALRIHTWTWFFHVFNGSPAWMDEAFQESFLRVLYLHGDFTVRNLEKSDINGNHYTADAAGLVFAGLFFARGSQPNEWLEKGWRILCQEIENQVFPDGVDFESSIPYHRLVQELFLFPALYRIKNGLTVPTSYSERLIAMAKFTAAYSRPDGSIPLWGDADDARVLPFSRQPINDHRYLIGITGLFFNIAELIKAFSGPKSEVMWTLGVALARSLQGNLEGDFETNSQQFPNGGFYVLRDARNHIFIDCGPVGLGGRGGHGHNDLLSFEAMLDGVHLISDCGAYLYTANFEERNNFRSTAYHNTPQIDDEEINRFILPEYLWLLNNDAQHQVIDVSFNRGHDRIKVSHNGYDRLPSPVRVIRTFELDHGENSLTVCDEFEGEGDHSVRVPFHLAEDVVIHSENTSSVILINKSKRFILSWMATPDWKMQVESGWISQSYGIKNKCIVLVFNRKGLLKKLNIVIKPH